MRIKQLMIQHPYEWLSAILLFVFFFPLVFMPNQALFLIHDNLDSNVVWYKRLAESGLMFGAGNAVVDFTMGGIPRDCLPSEWNVERLLYYFFTPQWAYTLNYILIHCIAFVGMRLLIKNYISNAPVIFNLVSLAFALLPFWPSGGITVAGLPFLGYSLLNIFKNKSITKDWFFILFFPFYSSLAFGNLFSFPLVFAFYLLCVLLRKLNFKWMHFIAFVILGISTIITEYRLLNLLLSGFESNRLADIPNVDSFMNFKGIVGSTLLAFAFGHYHFHSLHFLIAVFVVLFTGYYIIKRDKEEHKMRVAILFVLGIGALSFITIFLNNFDVKGFFGEWFPKVSVRFWVVYPLIWYAVFALTADYTYKLNKRITTVILGLQVIFVMFLLYPKDYFGSRYAENIFANTIVSNSDESQKWKEYYRVKEFDLLKKQVPDITDQYVVRVGIIPEILQYNGLKTLEGYYAFYPIERLIFVRSIDSIERANIPNKSSLYSNRNFLFYDSDKKSEPDWNWELLKKAKVKYIVSNNTIENDSALELIFDNELKVYKIVIHE